MWDGWGVWMHLSQPHWIPQSCQALGTDLTAVEIWKVWQIKDFRALHGEKAFLIIKHFQGVFTVGYQSLPPVCRDSRGQWISEGIHWRLSATPAELSNLWQRNTFSVMKGSELGHS